MRRFFQRVLNFLRPHRGEGDLSREVASHLALLEDEYRRRGMAPERARQAARRSFGSVAQAKDLHREARSFVWLDDARMDFRQALRGCTKSPGFTAVAVLTLAAGIATNTAIFSVVNAVMIRPLPYSAPERLVRIWESNEEIGRPSSSVSYPNFLDWRATARAFEAMAAIEGDSFTMGTSEGAEIVRGANVTPHFLDVLGIAPAFGRNFLAEEERSGAGTRVAIITDAFWNRRFGSDRSVLGRRIRLDGDEYTIVGVLPPAFRWGDVEMIATPLDADPAAARGNHILTVIGRLRDGATIERAQDELATVARGLSEQFPESNRGWSVRLASFHDWLIPNEIRHALVILLGAVGVVLLIACANVTNLLLARAVVRQKELSIRAALGAARGRIVRQLFTESLLLSLLAAVTGLLGAAAVMRLLMRYGPANLPRLEEVSFDLNVTLFALAASLGTAFLFGTIPAIFVAHQPAALALQDVARGSTGGRGRQRLRATLTVVEVALSVTLLIGAGLLLRSFWNLQRVSPGFSPESVMVARVATQAGSNRRLFYERLLSEIRTLPGMVGAAATSGIPLWGGNTVTEFLVPGSVDAPRGEASANWRLVSPGYFNTMGIPLRGRDYAWNDAAPRTSIIISEAMARTHWPNQDPIGKTIVLRSLGNRARTVIGVAGDVRHLSLEADERSMVYYSVAETVFGEMRIVWRSNGDPAIHAGSVREVIRRVDQTAALYDVRPLDDVVSDYFAARRFNMYLLGVFATVAVLLAAVGLFGVMGYLVSQRTREIGVRVALGADRRSIFGLILGHGLALTAAGIVVGLGGALWLTRVMRSLLFSVSSSDPMTFAAVPVLLLLVALGACYLPARRAARVDPLVALRYE
jgi:predicted permease